MAKALFGHVGVGADVRMTDELMRLRRRVSELETELIMLRRENAALAAAVEEHEGVLALTVPDSLREPADALA